MNEHRFRCGCSIAWDERGVSRFHTALERCAKARALAGTYRNFADMVRAFCRAHGGRLDNGEWITEARPRDAEMGRRRVVPGP